MNVQVQPVKSMPEKSDLRFPAASTREANALAPQHDLSDRLSTTNEKGAAAASCRFFS